MTQRNKNNISQRQSAHRDWSYRLDAHGKVIYDASRSIRLESYALCYSWVISVKDRCELTRYEIKKEMVAIILTTHLRLDLAMTPPPLRFLFCKPILFPLVISHICYSQNSSHSCLPHHERKERPVKWLHTDPPPPPQHIPRTSECNSLSILRLFPAVPSHCVWYNINVTVLSQTRHLPLLILSLQGYMFRPEKATIRHTYKIHKIKVLGVKPPPFFT
jgi:hypothetical protein